RERELLAERLERLVGREPGPDRRDLEEHAARLAEVDRLEVEAVDHRRRPCPGLGDPPLPRLVLLRWRRPRHVVDGAGTADTALGGRRVVDVERAAGLPARLEAGFEAEHVLEERPARLRIGGEGTDAGEAAQRV